MQIIVNFTQHIRSHQADGKGFLRLAVSLWIAFTLAACTSISDLPVTDESYQNWEEHRLRLSEINIWALHARAVIYVEQDVYQVGINWQRDADDFIILIEAPFGQGVFRIESDPENGAVFPVKLLLPDGQVFYDETAEALLLRVIGWSLPVSGLKSWIKGQPLIETGYTFHLRSEGRLKSLSQDGWSINYLAYFEPDSVARGLPRKIYLKHENLALKIVIDRWQQLEQQTDSSLIFPDFD